MCDVRYSSPELLLMKHCTIKEKTQVLPKIRVCMWTLRAFPLHRSNYNLLMRR